MNTKLILFLTLIFLFFSCNKDDENVITYPETLELTYDFQNDDQSWEGDFADYPLGEESFYELSYELSNLPTPLNTNSGALKQSGNNHSDDLFMFIRRQINGLKPNTDYRVSYEGNGKIKYTFLGTDNVKNPVNYRAYRRHRMFDKLVSLLNSADKFKKDERVFTIKFEDLLLNILKNKNEILLKKNNLEKLNYRNTWNNVNHNLLNIINEN